MVCKINYLALDRVNSKVGCIEAQSIINKRDCLVNPLKCKSISPWWVKSYSVRQSRIIVGTFGYNAT
jgi:hypothetical protein